MYGILTCIINICILFSLSCSEKPLNTSDINKENKVDKIKNEPNSFSNLQILTKDAFVLINDDGIWKTNNSGESWKRVVDHKLPSKSSAISFYNASKGYITLDRSLMKTDDGGETWHLVSSLSVSPQTIYFLNENVGWIGSGKEIFHTKNGGINWEKQTLSIPETIDEISERWNIKSVFFLDQLNGWATGYSSLFQTLNGGKNWRFIENQISDYRSIEFINTNVGWLSHKRSGIFWLTENSGISWREINTPLMSTQRGSLFFVDQNRGYLLDATGRLFKTKDRRTWTEIVITNSIRNDLFEQNITGETFLGTGFDGSLVAIWFPVLHGKSYPIILISNNNGHLWELTNHKPSILN